MPEEKTDGSMRVVQLDVARAGAVRNLMLLGTPYVQARTPSDYWLYATLFSNTCPVVVEGGEVVGAAIAFRSQTEPHDVYIQDVMTHPRHRHQGVARLLLDDISRQGRAWGCRRLYVTSEPSNKNVHRTWLSLGFANVPGDHAVDGVFVVRNYKGVGKDRSLYELVLAQGTA